MFLAQIEQNRTDAVKHLLEIRHISNPESLKRLADGIYEHTNRRGVAKQYHVYDTFKSYAKSADYADGKLYKVNSFCIVEKLKK